jgi:S-DNA-T family DNA segregation ATPase FtsK/SpoIIIE
MRLRTLNLYETLFPHRLRRGLWHSGLGVTGMLMMAAAAALGAALLSWSAADPSFSHATGAPAGNWLGAPGAALADLMIQFFGLASVAPALMLAGWGWHLACGRAPAGPIGRLALGLASMAVLAGYLSSLSAPEHWQLLVGLGGVLGDGAALWLAPVLAYVASGLGATIESIAAALIALVALACLAHASGIAPPAIRRAGGAEPCAVPGVGPGRILFVLVLVLLRTVRWLWRLGVRAGARLAAALRRFSGDDGIDPKDRLRLAMERVDSDDLAWTSSAELYAANRARRAAAPPDRDDGAARRLPPTLTGSIAARLRTLAGSLWSGSDPAEPYSALARPEPRFAAMPAAAGVEPHDEPPADAPAAAARRPRPRRPAPAVIPDDTDLYQLPPLSLLNEAPPARPEDALTQDTLVENARLLEGVLDDFGVRGQIIDVRPGPVVTLYELEPAPGLKSSRVIGLADDIARSMSAISARVAVVPGRNAIGIELPNDRRLTVYLHEVFASRHFAGDKHALALTLGKNIGGEPIIVDLARMPHLLIAGTTGSGKSVGINAMILSLLFRKTPEECRLIMIDPKMLELSVYDGIPHLLSPVVTDPHKAIVALKWAVREMEARYKIMSKVGVRNIDGFNKRAREAAAKGEVLTRTVQTGFDRDTGEAIYESEEIALKPMPYIVVVVDEMADLMMVAGKEIEAAIQRLAQMARAAGIHIIMATQRPSVDVITGTIKANFPTRISFQVTSKIDSRTILGEQGAEQLLGQGDMLFMAGGGRISRVHGAFVSDEEVETVVQFLKRQGVPEYLDAVTAESEGGGGEGGDDFMSAFDAGNSGSEADQLYDQAVAVVARDRKASTSYIQRRLQIGYNRAATIIERMENEGVVGPANHAGKREILVPEPGFSDD